MAERDRITRSGRQLATLNSWSATDVRLQEVMAALDELRRPERLSSTRASVLTMVVVAGHAGSAGRAMAALHELGGRHPARTVVIVPDREGAEPGIDAEVRLMGSRSDGRAAWFEDVELHVQGPALDHLDSLIEPFLISDLPVVCWFVDRLPAIADPLLGAADVVVVDSRDLGGVDCFAVLDGIGRRRPVVDLSWVRLRPWRELLARLFEGPDFRPFVHGVTRATVTGKIGPRHLLAGWLVDRLGLSPAALELAEDQHASVRLEATHDGRPAVFRVARRGSERVVVASAAVEGGPAFETPVVLPDATPGWGLAEGLSRLSRDPLYQHALQAAMTL